MAIELVNLRRGGADRMAWVPPFDFEIHYENDCWWDDAPRVVDAPWFVQVLEDGVEVARVELVDPGRVFTGYISVPELGPERLQIHLFEVATDARGRGVGTRAVQALEDEHPRRRLFAHSEGADPFWAALGWERFDHPEGELLHQPLFVEPLGQ